MDGILASGYFQTNMFGLSLVPRILIWVVIIAVVIGAVAYKRSKSSP